MTGEAIGTACLLAMTLKLKSDKKSDVFVMENTIRNLKSLIKGKALFVGVGNTMRSDDGAGVYLIKKLKNYECLNAGVSPENYLGKICKIRPDTIIFFDVAEFNGKPGEIRIFSESKIKQLGISTHHSSIRLSMMFLKKELGIKNIHLVGIQPKKIDMGNKLSKDVKKGTEDFIKSFKLTAIFLIFALFNLSGCGNEKFTEKTQILMGSEVSISVPDSEGADKAIDSAFLEIKRIESVFNIFDEQSEAAKINSAAYKNFVTISPEMLYLIKKSIELNKETLGAFDVSIGALIKLWGFSQDSKARIPKDKEIRQALKSCGLEKVAIDEKRGRIKFLAKGLNLNFNAIAAGYAVDEAVKKLRSFGINNAIVNAGGDIYCLGRGKSKKGWKIGIQHPRKENAILGSFYIKDKAVTTSGDYQKFFEIEGKRFSHIIDPKTGYTKQEISASATVIAKDCLTADVYATALCVLGPEKGMELIERQKDIEAVIVSVRDGRLDIKVSSGLKGKVDWLIDF